MSKYIVQIKYDNGKEKLAHYQLIDLEEPNYQRQECFQNDKSSLVILF